MKCVRGQSPVGLPPAPLSEGEARSDARAKPIKKPTKKIIQPTCYKSTNYKIYVIIK
jgi:hypothetical protein